MIKIVIASNNENKVREIKHLLKGTMTVLSLKEEGFNAEIEETG